MLEGLVVISLSTFSCLGTLKGLKDSYWCFDVKTWWNKAHWLWFWIFHWNLPVQWSPNIETSLKSLTVTTRYSALQCLYLIASNFGIKILVAFYYRGSLHFVISELVIPAISYISVTNFGNSLPIHDFHKKTHTKYFQNFDKNFPKKKKILPFFQKLWWVTVFAIWWIFRFSSYKSQIEFDNDLTCLFIIFSGKPILRWF